MTNHTASDRLREAMMNLADAARSLLSRGGEPGSHWSKLDDAHAAAREALALPQDEPAREHGDGREEEAQRILIKTCRDFGEHYAADTLERGQEANDGAHRAVIAAMLAFAATHPSDAPKALSDIAAERARQVAKGWTAEHDDAHSDGELAVQAGMIVREHNVRRLGRWDNEPDEMAWVNYQDHSRRDGLVIASALLVAEIERLDRATSLSASGDAPKALADCRLGFCHINGECMYKPCRAGPIIRVDTPKAGGGFGTEIKTVRYEWGGASAATPAKAGGDAVLRAALEKIAEGEKLLDCGNVESRPLEAVQAQNIARASLKNAGREQIEWLCKDDAEVALWQAIEAIKLGNKTDDKLILENLRVAGIYLARFASAEASDGDV